MFSGASGQSVHQTTVGFSVHEYEAGTRDWNWVSTWEYVQRHQAGLEACFLRLILRFLWNMYKIKSHLFVLGDFSCFWWNIHFIWCSFDIWTFLCFFFDLLVLRLSHAVAKLVPWIWSCWLSVLLINIKIIFDWNWELFRFFNISSCCYYCIQCADL